MSTRKPAAFRLDDPHVHIAGTEQAEAAKGRGAVRVIPEPDNAADTLVPEVTTALPRPRFPWGALFWSALGGLVMLGGGLAVTSLIEDLYARAPWLGILGMVLAGLTGIALLVIAAKEIAGLMRLRSIETLRANAQAAIAADDRDAAGTVVRDLNAMLSRAPQLARARGDLETHLHEIIDGADLVRLAERKLMGPLDQEASRLIGRTATRVSLVTAVSPRAAIDMAFVFIAALGLIRRLAALYGGRPGTLGLIRLLRQIIAHLAVTGGMAAGDSLVQQMLGHGVAAKLSARLGEGVLNGLLTARLGVAAMDMVRPLPFAALPKPALSDIAGDLLRRDSEPSGRNIPLPPG
jgi:putative membrane protein